MERWRAIIVVLILIGALTLIGVAGVISWWVFIEKPYRASITEIEVEIPEFESPDSFVPVNKGLWAVRLRKIDTKEVIDVKFNEQFRLSSGEGLPMLCKRVGFVYLDRAEIGEGSVYRIRYTGTVKAEVKNLIHIELIQSRKELVRKMASGDEMPDISEYHFNYSFSPQNYKIEEYYRFNIEGAHIRLTAYYNTTSGEDVLKALKARYIIEKHSNPVQYLGKIWIIKAWMKEGDSFKLYNLGENSRGGVFVSEEDGSVKFKLHIREGDGWTILHTS